MDGEDTMKRYLGIICLLYTGIFGYVVFFDKIKFFLAPQMQIYIKLSIVPMLLIGLVMLFDKNVHYKFKISDLVLLLPVILLIFAHDGRLTSSFASNRMTNFNRTKSELNEEISIDVPEETIDFSNPYFDIVDNNYEGLSGYITYAPKAFKFAGKTIRVRGFALTVSDYLPNGYFAIGKYAISCCAADASFTGFIVQYNDSKIEADNWYEIEGILEKGKDKEGYDMMYIRVINVKEISSKSEEQYVYPCYAYDDGSCESVSKYNLEY